MAPEVDGSVKKVQSTMYGKLAYTKKFQEDGKFHYLVTSHKKPHEEELSCPTKRSTAPSRRR